MFFFRINILHKGVYVIKASWAVSLEKIRDIFKRGVPQTAQISKLEPIFEKIQAS